MEKKNLPILSYISYERREAFLAIWPKICENFASAKGKRLACLMLAIERLKFLNRPLVIVKRTHLFVSLKQSLPGDVGTYRAFVIGLRKSDHWNASHIVSVVKRYIVEAASEMDEEKQP